MSSNNNPVNFSYEDAIKELVKLEESSQIDLITQLFTQQDNVKNIEFLYVIIYEVSYLLERYESDIVLERLEHDGISRNVSVILLDRLQQLPPNEQVDARILESISDTKFMEIIEISNKHDFTSKTIDELSTEYQIERGILNSSIRFLRNIVWRHLQGVLAIDEIEPQLTLFGISKSKIELICNNLQNNLENLRKILIFNAVSDGTSSLTELHQRMNRLDEGMGKIWQAIKDLTDSLGGNTSTNASTPGIN